MNKYVFLILFVVVIATPVIAETPFVLKSVTVYPQNVALLNSEADVSQGNEFSTTLEQQAITSSLRLNVNGESADDVRIVKKEVKTEQKTEQKKVWSLTDLFEKDKRIRLIMGDEDIEGTVISTYGDLLFLSGVRNRKTNEDIAFMSVKIGGIDNVLLSSVPVLPDKETISPQVTSYSPYYPVDPQDLLLSWRDAKSGQRKVKLSYLASGYSWSPVYVLDTTEQPTGLFGKETAKFGFFAQITVQRNVTDALFRLIAGQIRLSLSGYSSRDYEYSDTMAQSELRYTINAPSTVGSSLPSVSSLAEYEVYEMLERLSMKKGETLMKPIFDGNVRFEKLYVYDARSSNSGWQSYNNWEQESDGKVQRIYVIYNEDKTWANGIVSVYQDGILIGQDSIEWTPKGREAKVTVGLAGDISASKKETVKKFLDTKLKYESWDYAHTVTISMKNFKKDSVTLRILDSYPRDAKEFSSEVDFKETPGNVMEWNIDLKGGEEKMIKYSYVTD